VRSLTALLLALTALAATSVAAAAAPIPAGGLNGLGCIANPTDAPLFGCSAGDASLMGLHDIALSPNGQQLYAVGEDGEDSVPGRLVTLARNGATGGLAFSACRASALPSCTADTHLHTPFAIDLAPDGSDLYVADAGRGVVHYRRAADGGLTFASCVTPTPTAGCTDAPGLGGADGVAVSPDGDSVYVASYTSSAVAVLDRDPTTGTLAFVECHTTAGTPGCTDAGANGLDAATDVTVTADSGRVYLSARGSSAIGFTRDPADGRLTSPQPLTSDDYLLGAQTVAVAPQGNVLYAGLFDGSGLTTLSLAPATGAPSLLACWRNEASPACTTSPGTRGVFGLDFSPDGGILYAAARDGSTLASFRRGANGALALASCAYAPEVPAAGCDHAVKGLAGVQSVVATGDGRFVYGAGYSTITILEPEHGPVCTPLARSVANGRSTDLQVNCSDADGQPLGHAIAVQPAHGKLTVLDAATGRFRYRPTTGYDGQDSFGFTASDGTNVSPAAVVRLEIPRDARAPRMRILTKRVRLTRRGKAQIRLRCLPGEPGGCVGRLSARSAKKLAPQAAAKKPRKRFVELGSRRFSIAEGRTKRITVAVPKTGRRILDSKGRLRVLLTATAKDPSGNSGRAKLRIALLEPKPAHRR
jgi:DNA-binding beta-propeller fold protein YncE